MIELENVSKRFAEFEAVSSISLNISKSDGITALLGPNGAGKSTTMRLMTGYLKPSTGEVRIQGQSLEDEAARKQAKQIIGYLPESAPLYPEMLVCEFLEFSAKVRGIKDKKIVNEKVQSITEQLDLSGHFYSPISSLSKGFRQRTALGATLIHDPQIIILDEPTSGLDPNQITQIRSIIRELGKSRTLILSTHILKEVEDIAERVIIISRGRIAADRRKSDLTDGAGVRVRVRGPDPAGILEKIPIVSECRESSPADTEGFQEFFCSLREDRPEKLFSQICASGLEAKEFSTVKTSLEEIFRQVTGE